MSAYALLSGCASLSTFKEAPRITLINLKLIESTPFEQRYQLEFRVQNPNTESMSVSGMHFTLELNDKKFMTGLSNQATTIPAFSDVKITGTGTTTLFGIARQLQGLQNNSTSALTYRLHGKISIRDKAFSIPFDITDSIKLQ